MRWYLLIVRGDIVELKGPFPSLQARSAYARNYCHMRGKGGGEEVHKLDIDESGIPILERGR